MWRSIENRTHAVQAPCLSLPGLRDAAWLAQSVQLYVLTHPRCIALGWRRAVTSAHRVYPNHGAALIGVTAAHWCARPRELGRDAWKQRRTQMDHRGDAKKDAHSHLRLVLADRASTCISPHRFAENPALSRGAAQRLLWPPEQKPAEVTGILTDADLPRASWKLELSSAGYQKPGTAKLRARERVLALPEQLALTTSQPPVSWPPFS